MELPFVLALLNSRFFDFIFRHINSNTQVSAGELNSLPCPQTAALAEKQRPLIKLVERIPTAKARDAGADVSALERGLDELVCALYSLTKEEQAIVQGADV